MIHSSVSQQFVRFTLAYVAATRARDLLVVPVCGDQPLAGWLEVLNPALLPADEAKRQSVPVSGAPSFGEETVVDRGEQGMAPATCTCVSIRSNTASSTSVCWAMVTLPSGRRSAVVP